MHLADAFIQSDLQCIQAIHFFISMCVLWELNPQPFALLTQCSTTEPQEHTLQMGPYVKGSHLTRSDICQWAQDRLSSKYSSMVLSVISPYSQPVISQISCSSCWMQGCQFHVFFPQNWATFKLLPWVDFPKWVKGLKYCINYMGHSTEWVPFASKTLQKKKSFSIFFKDWI